MYLRNLKKKKTNKVAARRFVRKPHALLAGRAK